MSQWIDLEREYVAHNYFPLPVVLTKGKGVWVWDDKDKKYLDMMSAYSAVSHGHSHPKLVKVLCKQAKKLSVISRAFYSDRLGLLMKELCQLSGMDRGLPMNTGAEAVETAIKAARLWGYCVKGVQKNHAEIIVASNNFHGRTTTIVSFSTEEKSKENFGPFTPGFKVIPYGSIDALKSAITPNTCAFLVEPIQGEAGIILPPEGWLTQVSTLCKKNHILLLLDEIQTGLGRTGKLFAFQHEGIYPDGLILGKALGGGLLPVSAFLARKEVMELFTPGTHGSTFGGNPLASTVALEALRLLKSEGLVEKSRQLGLYFLNELKKFNSPYITDIRGKGLWIGIDVDPKQISGRQICELLMEEGILTKDTHGITVRLAPPLVITQKEIDWALKKLKKVFCPLDKILIQTPL